jgi:hypothetical protein
MCLIYLGKCNTHMLTRGVGFLHCLLKGGNIISQSISLTPSLLLNAKQTSEFEESSRRENRSIRIPMRPFKKWRR